jgi:hypothetical protein
MGLEYLRFGLECAEIVRLLTSGIVYQILFRFFNNPSSSFVSTSSCSIIKCAFEVSNSVDPPLLLFEESDVESTFN